MKATHHLLAGAVAVLLRQAHRRAAVRAAGDDGDLVERVGVFDQGLHDGVAGFVVGGGLLFLVVDDLALASPAEANLVAGLFEVFLLDVVLLGERRDECGLVDRGGEVGTAEAGRRPGDPRQVDVRPELHLAGVDLEDLHATLDVRQRNLHLTVESAGTGQGRVEHVDAVGRGDDDDLVVRVEAVHLDEDGIERLLTLVVTARREAAAATSADGVDFVEEDDARRVVLGLLEEVADAARPDADEHLDEVGTADGEEGRVGLAGDGLGEERLARSGRAYEQAATWDASAEALELLGISEELDDFRDLVLGFFDACDIVESDVGLLLDAQAVLASAEVAEHARRTATAAERPDEEEVDEGDEENPGDDREQVQHPIARHFSVDDQVVAFEEFLCELVVAGGALRDRHLVIDHLDAPGRSGRRF